MKDRFEGKAVMATDAASDIGEATARRFSAEGAKVVLLDRYPLLNPLELRQFSLLFLVGK